MRKLKFTAAAAVAVLCISGFTAAVAAEETEMSITAESILVTDNIDLPDSEELFEGYVEKTFYGDCGASVYSLDLGERLTGNDKKVYDLLKTKIGEIADGKSNNTQISIKATDIFGTDTITKAAVGCNDDFTTTEGKNALLAYVSINYTKVLEVLRADCCYELYWYDKTRTGGVSYTNGWNMTYYSETAQITSSQVFKFSVSADYSESGTTNTYVTDTDKTAAAKTAATNAKTVVSNNAGKTDIEKLFAYKQYICDSVSYNHDAASSSYSGGYGNPWQLIYVFDGDDKTNVVCEGYAKAFQYLCDLSAFSSPEIYCISVTGEMDGGGHMWNVMHMDDGKNYLVDVTNSDTGTFGQDGSLFLTGYGASDGNTSYTFSNTNGSSKLTFVYDTNTTSIYSAEELALTDDIYHWDYNGDGRCDEVGCGKIIDGFGATLAGYTLSLNGNIGVNFYMELSDTIINDTGAYMKFILPNGDITKVMVADVKASPQDVNGKKFYIFPCEVAAKEMTAEIKAQMFDGSGTGGAVYTYTVKEYADYILNAGTYDDKTVSLVKAMLNYGAYSQVYFNYNNTIGKLANESLSAEDKSLGEIDTASAFALSAPVFTKSPTDPDICTFDTAYLTLVSETSVNVYIKLNDGIDANEVTFKVNGTEVTPKKVGDRYLITASNIKAGDLDNKQSFTVTYNGITSGLEYSAYSYVRSVLSNNRSEALTNLAKAIYRYNTAAETYTA